MGLEKYIQFIDDVRFYLSDIIIKYKLKVYHDLETDLNQAVFLENENIKIWLSTLVNFPHQSVYFDFHLNKKKISRQELLIYWNLSEKEFDKLFLEIYSKTAYPNETEFCGYQKDLIVISKILEKYYLPIVRTTGV